MTDENLKTKLTNAQALINDLLNVMNTSDINDYEKSAAAFEILRLTFKAFHNEFTVKDTEFHKKVNEFINGSFINKHK